MSLCRLQPTSIFRWLSPPVGLLFCFLGVMPAGAQPDRPTTEDEVRSLPQVTIEGQKDTDQRVRKFVGDLTGKSAAEDSLARWGRAICPIVLGPPRDERAVVLGRLAEDSRIKLSDVLRFNSVIVVVDIGRAQDIKLGQLADYIAMVGLGRIHLDAVFDGEPTILRIFTPSAAESGETAPSSITDWDLDFLKALYSTSQSSRLQRAAISDRMLRDIAH
jgi:hypothetical protein